MDFYMHKQLLVEATVPEFSKRQAEQVIPAGASMLLPSPYKTAMDITVLLFILPDCFPGSPVVAEGPTSPACRDL
jgi:hypothetical protein